MSWDEWLAEMDKQGLALKVSDDPSGGSEREYQIIARSEA